MTIRRLHSRFQFAPVLFAAFVVTIVLLIFISKTNSDSVTDDVFTLAVVVIAFTLAYLLNFRFLRRVYFDNAFIHIKPLFGGQVEKINFSQVLVFNTPLFSMFKKNGGGWDIYKLKYLTDNGGEKMIKLYPTKFGKTLDEFNMRVGTKKESPKRQFPEYLD